jgi:hypothetical protein
MIAGCWRTDRTDHADGRPGPGDGLSAAWKNLRSALAQGSAPAATRVAERSDCPFRGQKAGWWAQKIQHDRPAWPARKFSTDSGSF